jgi:4-amino-4-deoxy-L-arabinose transferase-like glycosyltransferase
MRLISVLLGGLTVVLVYYLAKALSANNYIRLLASFFTLSNMILAHNARFAHNDLYLLFFVTLALFSLVKYRLSGSRLWIYLAFFSVGCGTSSKYTGASYAVVVVLVFLIENWGTLLKNKLLNIETFTIGVGLAILGYGIGTPKFLLWMSFYLKRMLPAALRQSVYGRSPDSLAGWVAQWKVFEEGVGSAFYYLFLFSLIWYGIQFVRRIAQKSAIEDNKNKGISVILLSILIFDIPFLIAYHFQTRFFLPFVPMFSVLSSLLIESLLNYVRKKDYKYAVPAIWGGSILIVLFSFVSIASIVLLFKNDARIQAGEFLKTLKSGTNIEYTLYPPQIPENYFSGARNYPIYLVKYPGDEVPTNKPYQYNLGEAGLYEREADYLVVDSFTYARFSDDYICETNPVECDFFKKLLAGETSLHLLKEFEYSLPPYLPQIELTFVNPDVKVYEIPR